jgi:hypothetical protein
MSEAKEKLIQEFFAAFDAWVDDPTNWRYRELLKAYKRVKEAK